MFNAFAQPLRDAADYSRTAAAFSGVSAFFYMLAMAGRLSQRYGNRQP